MLNRKGGVAAVLGIALAATPATSSQRVGARGEVVSAGALGALPAAVLGTLPAAARQDTLRLDRAVDIALASSPELRQAEAQAYAAGAGRLEAWGRLLPSVTLSTRLNRSGSLLRRATDPTTGDVVIVPNPQLYETFSTDGSLSVDWTVFSGGQQLMNIRRVAHETAAARLSLDAARARIGAGVKLAYLDALEADALLRVRQADVERADALAEAAQARFEVGEAPEIDVLQARVALNDADLALSEAEVQAEGARLALLQYLSGELSGEVVLLAPSRPAVVEWVPDRIRACALRHSAELAALEARASAGRTAATAAAWSFLPTVRVGATWIRYELGDRTAITTDLTNEQRYYRLTMSWNPLDQPGQWLANRRRAAAQEAETAAALAVRRPAVERQVELGLTRLQRARLLRERTELNLELAARQREQASERYRLGLAPITEMLQAEALAREAERQAVAARFADQRALAELENAAGVSLEAMQYECQG
jgi:outer membrane protein TolC